MYELSIDILKIVMIFAFLIAIYVIIEQSNKPDGYE